VGGVQRENLLARIALNELSRSNYKLVGNNVGLIVIDNFCHLNALLEGTPSLLEEIKVRKHPHLHHVIPGIKCGIEFVVFQR
jgi:hypothetical protein